jgi:hypothetical protein
MLKFILLCIVAISGYYAWSVFPIKHGPGVTAPNKPNYKYVAWNTPFNFKGNTLEPVRNISGQVRVLAKKQYFFDERKELSPIDILVGWDEMSDERNVEFIQFSLNNRYFDMEYTRPPIPEKKMYQQMELLHLIPSTPEIEKQVKRLRSGSIISIEGVIVNVESNENFNWTSDITSRNEKELRNLILWLTKLN